jgi:hypothetical protein
MLNGDSSLDLSSGEIAKATLAPRRLLYDFLMDRSGSLPFRIKILRQESACRLAAVRHS